MSNKTPKPHDHSALHDPVKVGPGLWHCIHSECKECVSEATSALPIAFIYRRQANFPCPNCKVHFGDYLASHPPGNIDFSNPTALFDWSVDFHNDVNFRKGKAPMSYEEARSLYYKQSDICTETCEEAGAETTPVKIPSVTFKPLTKRQ